MSQITPLEAAENELDKAWEEWQAAKREADGQARIMADVEASADIAFAALDAADTKLRVAQGCYNNLVIGGAA